MARGDEPLLARNPSDDPSDDRNIEEEDALLTGQRTGTADQPRWRKWREAGAWAWAVAATVAVVVLAVMYEESQRAGPAPTTPTGKRNLVFMVSDGMGPTSLALTRSFRQYKKGLPYDDALVLDKYVIGTSRTRSSSSLITDSAAGATAFSCGKKTYNGAIAVEPDFEPCGTVLEAAKRAGYVTGLVVTTRITDATPACFASHVNRRDDEDKIAEQLLGDYPLGRTVDLLMGAGRCYFLPKSAHGSCRNDTKDLISEAQKKGWNYVGTRKDFDRLGKGRVKLPMLALFADEDIPYEIDRQHEKDKYPSLQEMTETALNALKAATKDSDKGFFLMVEGSRIDHAGHANDPVTQVHEVLAYDEAFQEVLKFLDNDDTQGLLVGTSDHETGGLSTARQLEPFKYPIYHWFPAVLANATHSCRQLAHDFYHHTHLSEVNPLPSSAPKGKPSPHTDGDDLANTRDASSFLRDALPKYLGISDATDAEIQRLVERPGPLVWLLADMISRRSQTGWSTHGHSGADVNIYASDHRVAARLVGNHENTDIGVFLRTYLDVDVDAVTDELKRKGKAWDRGKSGAGWMGRRPVDGERLDGGSHLDRYEGDFRMHRH